MNGIFDDELLERLSAKIVVLENGCHEWLGYRDEDGYGRISVNGRSFLAHRLVYQLVIGHIPEGMCCCHRCDFRACVNVEHLFLGSHADNMADCKRKGRWPLRKGQNAILTQEEASHVKWLARHGPIRNWEIAERYKVSQKLITEIKMGRVWAHVTPAKPPSLRPSPPLPIPEPEPIYAPVRRRA
jgi:hypothetical protein